MAAVELLLLGAATSAATAATDRRARMREARAERDFPPLGRLLNVRGHRIHALTRGQGPDLVLIHGASGSLREFSFALIDRLAPSFRVTAFDRPGLGWSDAFEAATDPRAQAEALQEAARMLGIERPLVLGQSYGGAVAMGWALTAPDRTAGLVLVSGAVMPWQGPLASWYRIAASPVGRRAVIPLATAFASRRRLISTLVEIFAPEPVPEGYAEHAGIPLALRRASLRENARQVNGLLPELRQMARAYPSLTLPIEIVHGTADTVVPLAVHALPLLPLALSARLSRLEGAGHMPHHTRPQAVIDAIHRAAARAGLAPGPRAALH